MKLLAVLPLALVGVVPATASGVSLHYRFTVSRPADDVDSPDSMADSNLVPVVKMNQPLGNGVLHSTKTSGGLGPGCLGCEACIHGCDGVFEDQADWSRQVVFFFFSLPATTLMSTSAVVNLLRILATRCRCTAVCFDTRTRDDCRSCAIPNGRFDVFMNILDVAATTALLDKHGLLEANLSTDDSSRRWKQSGLKLVNLVELHPSLPANTSDEPQTPELTRNCSVCNGVVATCLIFMWLPFIWLP
ncbi:hypothetical protein MAPG_04585 [Magnaporthiopsis poae ATCC 64411]|uniref:4Fe-4S ferredoxin-type domain-containing protein n=1 Tax=Magnaporthiopsis poae (strain ATCC 64411 / 73-15) TaxID=644358 RepID=A0A0C4DX47_MAGP6|nr:hypothetical protein MAPG_04585 [Magnaporthiopsis poae ATCC 64411]